MDNLSNYDELKDLAWDKSNGFCYGCYVSAITKKGTEEETCPKCFTDDLMREVKGIGVEWGIEWVIKHLIEDQCEEALNSDLEDNYHEMLNDCYDKLGPQEWGYGDVLKEMDPIMYNCGYSEYIDSMIGESLCEIDDKHYWIHDIEAIN